MLTPVKSKAALLRTLTPGMVLIATYHGAWDNRTGQGSFERVIQQVRTKGFSYVVPTDFRGCFVDFTQKGTSMSFHDDGLGWDMLDEDGVIWASYRFA